MTNREKYNISEVRASYIKTYNNETGEWEEQEASWHAYSKMDDTDVLEKEGSNLKEMEEWLNAEAVAKFPLIKEDYKALENLLKGHYCTSLFIHPSDKFGAMVTMKKSGEWVSLPLAGNYNETIYDETTYRDIIWKDIYSVEQFRDTFYIIEQSH